MNERRRSSIAKLFHIPARLRRGSAIIEQDANTTRSYSSDLPTTLCNGLPAELQMLVLSQCSFEDIMTLRCVSRDYCNLVTLNGAALFRHFTQEDELATIASIYDCVILPSIEPSFHNFCGLRHRAIIADKFAEFLVTYRMCEKARIQPHVLRQNPRAIVRLRIAVIKLRPYFFILYHFFEAFRAILAYTSRCKGVWGDTCIEETSRLIEAWLLYRYTAVAKSRVMHLWDQVMRVVYRKLRPATYATKVERTLRGWNHPPASEKDIGDLLVFGGLEALYRVITVHGFASRRKAFDKMVLQVQTSSENSSRDHMRVDFGVMPPLCKDAIQFIRKRMQPDQPLRILSLSGPDGASPPFTQEEANLARQSDLGALAPLVTECENHVEMRFVADMPGKDMESLEICLRNPLEYSRESLKPDV